MITDPRLFDPEGLALHKQGSEPTVLQGLRTAQPEDTALLDICCFSQDSPSSGAGSADEGMGQ